MRPLPGLSVAIAGSPWIIGWEARGLLFGPDFISPFGRLADAARTILCAAGLWVRKRLRMSLACSTLLSEVPREPQPEGEFADEAFAKISCKVVVVGPRVGVRVGVRPVELPKLLFSEDFLLSFDWRSGVASILVLILIFVYSWECLTAAH